MRRMVDPDIEQSGIASEVINTVGVGPWNVRAGKVVPLNFLRFLGGKPLLAGIVVVANEFFLFGIHRNHRIALLQAFLYRCIDVPELRIAVWMVCSFFFRLSVALQTVVQIVENLRYLGMTDRMFLPAKLCGNGSRAFTNPAQG